MKRQLLTKQGLDRFLSNLEATDRNFVTAYIKPSSFPAYLDELPLKTKYSIYVDEIKDRANTKAIAREASKYGTGVIVFWGEDENKYLILPPFSIAENKVSTGKPNTLALRNLLERRYVTGLVLVAWGSYAIGVFDGDELVASKTGTGWIHKKHKKGGQSQKRFARRTEEQRKDFLRRISNRIEEIFEDFSLDHILFGGNRLIIKPLIQECKYLQSKTDKISPRILDVRYADREALSNSLREISKSLVFSF